MAIPDEEGSNSLFIILSFPRNLKDRFFYSFAGKRQYLYLLVSILPKGGKFKTKKIASFSFLRDTSILYNNLSAK